MGIEFIYHIHVTNPARSNRGVRRALIHRKRRYAGVTAGDGVISPPLNQTQTMRPRPSGSEVRWRTTGGLFFNVLARLTRPGPEGSSRYLDYRCSRDSGVENESGSLSGEL